MSVCLYFVFVLSSIGSGLARTDLPSKASYQLPVKIRNFRINSQWETA
jgi:hypothetical protein